MTVSQKAKDSFSTDHLQADLKVRSIRGALLTMSSQGAQFVIQSVATVVLAHLLNPADYGLVGMVTAVTGLGQAFADLGLSEATIQHPEINHDQVSKLFWVNVVIGVGLTAITAAMGPVLAAFYHESRLRAITNVVSLTFVVGGLRVQHDALLQRSMRFTSLAIRDVASYIVAVPTAFFLAWRGAGYWAIVALPLTINSLQMILSWAMVRWIPSLPRDFRGVRALIKFGGNVAASYLTINFTRSADSILIGRYWGAGPLGLYSRAMNLLLLPVRQLGAPARRVAVPAFSRVQEDCDRLARIYLRTANLIMWITGPIFGFLFVTATPVIVLTLGYKWLAAGPVFRILAIFALGQLLFESTIWLLISRGQSQRMLKMALIMCPIIVAGYVVGLPFGIKGVAWSGALVMLAILPWMLKFSFRGTSLTLQQLGKKLRYPVITTLAGVAAGELTSQVAAPLPYSLQILVVGVGFAAGCAIMALLRPVREEMNELRNLLHVAGVFSVTQPAEVLE